MDYKSNGINPLLNMPDFALLIYPAYLDKGKNRSLTRELMLKDKTPPIFTFRTTDDVHGNSSLVIAQVLKD